MGGLTLREWIDIQADIFSVSEANEPGGMEKAMRLADARRRVAAMKEADGDS